MALDVGRGSRSRREALWGYLMIAPMVIGLAVFFYLALGASLFISLSEWDILTPLRWVGLENYRELLSDTSFRRAMWNTTYYTLLSVPLGLIVFLPVLTMPVAIGVVWSWIYNPDFGLLSQLLDPLGFPRIRWLTDPTTAMPALVLMAVWHGSGFGMIIFLAGLQNIPREYYEAAHIDGASGPQRFRFVTLPLLSPTVFFVAVTSLISAYQVFDIVYAITAGQASDTLRTVVYLIYEEGFVYLRMGEATAIAWVLFALILLITAVQLWLQRRWVHYE